MDPMMKLFRAEGCDCKFVEVSDTQILVIGGNNMCNPGNFFGDDYREYYENMQLESCKPGQRCSPRKQPTELPHEDLLKHWKDIAELVRDGYRFRENVGYVREFRKLVAEFSDSKVRNAWTFMGKIDSLLKKLKKKEVE